MFKLMYIVLWGIYERSEKKRGSKHLALEKLARENQQSGVVK